MSSKQHSQSRACRLPHPKRKVGFEVHDAQELFSSLQAESAPAEIQRFFLAFRESEWPSQLQATDVLHLLNHGGQLAVRVRDELCGLRMAGMSLGAGSNEIDKQSGAKGQTFQRICTSSEEESWEDDNRAVVIDIRTASDSRTLEKLLVALGPALKKLTLDYERVRAFGMRGLAARCDGLRSLVLRDAWSEMDLGAVLRVCGRSLVSLSLYGKMLRSAHVTAVSAHCDALHTLRLHYTEWEECILEPWRTVGPTLRSLSLTCPLQFLQQASHHTELTIHVAQHCVNLEQLELHQPLHSEFAFVVDICSALGVRLLMLKLVTAAVFIFVDDVKVILKRCPNVIIDADIWHKGRPYKIEKTRRLPV